MRLVQTLMIAVLASAAVLVAVVARSSSQDARDAEASTMAALERMHREIRVRAGKGEVEVNGRGWPMRVEAAWFGASPPRNALVTPHRPWLEIASPEEADRLHPAVRQAVTDRVAAFWYNPGQGVIRARVGVMVSDAAALEAYNRVNGSGLDGLVDSLNR